MTKQFQVDFKQRQITLPAFLYLSFHQFKLDIPFNSLFEIISALNSELTNY